MASVILRDQRDPRLFVRVTKTDRDQVKFEIYDSGSIVAVSTTFDPRLLETVDALRNLQQGYVRLFCIQLDDQDFCVAKLDTAKANLLLEQLVQFSVVTLKTRIDVPTDEIPVSSQVRWELTLLAQGKEFEDMGRMEHQQIPVDGCSWQFLVRICDLEEYAQLFKQ